MTTARGIIFSLDDVLVETGEIHRSAWLTVAERAGIPITSADAGRLSGLTRERSARTLLESSGAPVSPAELEVLAAEKNATYRRLIRGLTPADVAPGAGQLLTGLRVRGLRLAVCSGSRNAKYILERVGLRGLFDAISDGENVTRLKPDPEVFSRAAEFLALEARDCLVVEGSAAGVEAAHLGGFRCYGFGEAADHPRVTARLDRLSDILAHL